jgi:hypothetical protein
LMNAIRTGSGSRFIVALALIPWLALTAHGTIGIPAGIGSTGTLLNSFPTFQLAPGQALFFEVGAIGGEVPIFVDPLNPGTNWVKQFTLTVPSGDSLVDGDVIFLFEHLFVEDHGSGASFTVPMAGWVETLAVDTGQLSAFSGNFAFELPSSPELSQYDVGSDVAGGLGFSLGLSANEVQFGFSPELTPGLSTFLDLTVPLIYSGNTIAGPDTFTDLITITQYPTVVPETATWGLGAGFMAFAALFLSRRRGVPRNKSS